MLLLDLTDRSGYQVLEENRDFISARPLDRAKIRRPSSMSFFILRPIYFFVRERRGGGKTGKRKRDIISNNKKRGGFTLSLFLDAFPIYLMFHRVYSNFLFLARVTFELRRVRVD